MQTSRQFGIAVHVVFELHVVGQMAGWVFFDKQPLSFDDALPQLGFDSEL